MQGISPILRVCTRMQNNHTAAARVYTANLIMEEENLHREQNVGATHIETVHRLLDSRLMLLTHKLLHAMWGQLMLRENHQEIPDSSKLVKGCSEQIAALLFELKRHYE